MNNSASKEAKHRLRTVLTLILLILAVLWVVFGEPLGFHLFP
jgi:hypothetical protein